MSQHREFAHLIHCCREAESSKLLKGDRRGRPRWGLFTTGPRCRGAVNLSAESASPLGPSVKENREKERSHCKDRLPRENARSLKLIASAPVSFAFTALVTIQIKWTLVGKEQHKIHTPFSKENARDV